MAQDFFPRKDAEVANFARVLSNRISADPERFGLTPEIVAEFETARQAFANAYAVTCQPAIRSQSAVALKNQTKKTLESAARGINRRIKAAGLAAAVLIELGLNPRNPGRGSAVGKPTVAPSPVVASVVGRRVRLKLREQPGSSRIRKPAGAAEAMIFACIGTFPSERREDWMFMCNTTSATVEVQFKDHTIAPGTRVWLVAYWSNRQGQGPHSRPVYADLQSDLFFQRNQAA